MWDSVIRSSLGVRMPQVEGMEVMSRWVWGGRAEGGLAILRVCRWLFLRVCGRDWFAIGV